MHNLKITKTILKNRVEFVKRYANVANELPNGAQEALSSRVGNITVSARDSFEIYLMGLNEVLPKHNYILFCKQFAEIFERKAKLILKKIQENRENNESYYISNEYFGQEFRGLFTDHISKKRKVQNIFMKFEKGLGNFGNKFIRGVVVVMKTVFKVGISGLIKSTKGNKALEVKWR